LALKQTVSSLAEAARVVDTQKTQLSKKFVIQVAAISAVIGMALGAFIVFAQQNFAGAEQVAAGQLSGRVALTEAQLRQIVVENELVAYWSGPQEGALYSIVSNSNGQVFIRYLPNGAGLDDTSANYRVIATYPQPDAYSITKAAGNQANAISFVNPDGAQVFFSKEFPTNIYIAYADSPYQIEIFDPSAGAALNLATAPKQISQIK
jgi:hypothetical protein